MTAPRCSLPTCANPTTDPSGRCRFHRSDAGPRPGGTAVPAVPTSSVVEFDGGEEIDENAPTAWTRISSGEAFTEITEWRRPGGIRHRDDGPAVVKRDTFSGKITEEIYYREGEVFRADGPSVTTYYNPGTGGLRSEQWRLGTELSRLGGPAYVAYDEDGSVRNESWSVGGRDLEANEETEASAFGKLTPARQVKEIEASPYAVFLAEGHSAEEISAAVVAGISTVEGVREVLNGAPAEWVRSFEIGESASS